MDNAMLTARSRPQTSGSVRSVDPTGRLAALAKASGAGKGLRRMLKQAVKIHPPEERERGYAEPQTFSKKIVRKVEVPVTRKVRVPVRTTKLVPTKEKRRVKTTKLTEVDGFKEVDEVVTVVKERPVEREREVWVKKVVKETVMVPYEEKVTRKKKVPCKVLKEVDSWEEVDVTTNKAVEVDGYRVDEVQDTKLVEVEEEHVYEMRPYLKDERVLGHRELGRAPRTQRGHLARAIGRKTYARDEDAASLHEAESDSDPDDVEIAPPPTSKTRIGFTLRQAVRGSNTVTKPVVQSVDPMGPAAKAGIYPGDVVVGVNGSRVDSVYDFRSKVSGSTGPVELQILRDGITNTVLVKRKARSRAAAMAGTRTFRK